MSSSSLTKNHNNNKRTAAAAAAANTMIPRTQQTQQQQRKKRPRPSNNNEQVLVEIRGVPAHVSPLLVQALRSCTQFFQNVKQKVILPPNESNKEQQPEITPITIRNNNDRGNNVMDSLLSRMEASSSETTERDKQTKKRERMDQDVQTLMDAIQKETRNASSDHHFTKNTSVPVSCMIYINGLFQSHGRVAVRRAALWIFGKLLSKSSDCRRHMFMENNLLLEWMESVVQAPQFPNWKHPSQAATQISLLQQEVLHWVSLLSEKHSEQYPKLPVARRYLLQHCPDLVALVDDTDTTTITNDASIYGDVVQKQHYFYNMPQLRQLRDLALQHGDKECARVNRLVQQSQACLDILVPRFGHDNVKETTKNHAVDKSHKDDNDDDESSVDWEEGDMDMVQQQEEATATENDHNNKESFHVQAVEQTLAAMQHTGGLLQSGALEIVFDESRVDAPENVATTNDMSRARLQKCVDRLTSRHVPRLADWVQGLTKADGLVLQGSSLVLLPAEQAQRRPNVLQSLLDAKASVASILKSAARLGVSPSSSEASQQQQSNNNNTTMRVAAATPTSGSRARIAQISSSTTRTPRQNNVARQRSNRVQIKYRTS